MEKKPTLYGLLGLPGDSPGDPNIVPGLGAFASEDATRWARIGRDLEYAFLFYKQRNGSEEKIPDTDECISHFQQLLWDKEKKKPGRPKILPEFSNDALRAAYCWKVAQTYPPIERAKLTNRFLIQCMKDEFAEHAAKVGKWSKFSIRLFPPDADIQVSVSKGKKVLKIEDDWSSELCEKYYGFLTKRL